MPKSPEPRTTRFGDLGVAGAESIDLWASIQRGVFFSVSFPLCFLSSLLASWLFGFLASWLFGFLASGLFRFLLVYAAFGGLFLSFGFSHPLHSQFLFGRWRFGFGFSHNRQAGLGFASTSAFGGPPVDVLRYCEPLASTRVLLR